MLNNCLDVLWFCIAQHDVPLCLTFQIQMRLEEKIWWLNFKTTLFMQPVSALFPVHSIATAGNHLTQYSRHDRSSPDEMSHISFNCSPLSMNFHSRDQRWSPVEVRALVWLVSPADHGPRPTEHLTSDICLPSPLDASIDKHTLRLTHDARLLLFMDKTDRKATDIVTLRGVMVHVPTVLMWAVYLKTTGMFKTDDECKW